MKIFYGFFLGGQFSAAWRALVALNIWDFSNKMENTMTLLNVIDTKKLDNLNS